MKGYKNNLEMATQSNHDFRKVEFTGSHSQLVLMSLKPGEEIGEEVHEVDQFLRLEQGSGQCILDGVAQEIAAEWAILVPAGVAHNILNTGTEEMKLYSIYSPPNHQKDTVHATKAEAEANEEHFDGATTE